MFKGFNIDKFKNNNHIDVPILPETFSYDSPQESMTPPHPSRFNRSFARFSKEYSMMISNYKHKFIFFHRIAIGCKNLVFLQMN